MKRMPRRRSSRAGPTQEEAACDDSSSPPAQNQGLSEYEVQRLSRIAENRKRMAALGLPQIARSLVSSLSSKRMSSRKIDVKGKRKLDNEDEDYSPNSEEAARADDDEDDVASVDDEEDGDYSAPRSTRKKGKIRFSKRKVNTPVKRVPNKSDTVDDEDELMQAIALSLQGNNEMTSPRKVADVSPNERSGSSQKGKGRSSFSSRVKMTEDELVLYFFQFDEQGRGSINVKDLAKLAAAHDFTWTERELVDMIHFFDTDGDGELGLDDFRKIVERCNMMQGPE